MSFERDIVKDIEDDTSGNFERGLKALVRTRAERAANFLYKAMKGLGTDNSVCVCVCVCV